MRGSEYGEMVCMHVPDIISVWDLVSVHVGSFLFLSLSVCEGTRLCPCHCLCVQVPASILDTVCV